MCAADIIFSGNFSSIILITIAVSLTVIAFNVFLLIRLSGLNKFAKRYSEYAGLLCLENIMPVKNISEYSGEKEITVVNDLKRAIRIGCIETGRLTAGNECVVFSDQFSELYDENKEQFLEKMESYKSVNESSDKTEEETALLEKMMEFKGRISILTGSVKDARFHANLISGQKLMSVLEYEISNQPSFYEKTENLIMDFISAYEILLEKYSETVGTQDTEMKQMHEYVCTEMEVLRCFMEDSVKKIYSYIVSEVFKDIPARSEDKETENTEE